MPKHLIIFITLGMSFWIGSSGSLYGGAPEQAGAALITYCQACHGVGKFRFIYSKNPAEVWNYIQTKSPQGSSRLWSEEIRDALSWPDLKPPPPGSLREPGKEWMPKGSRRQDIHTDRIGDATAREFLLQNL